MSVLQSKVESQKSIFSKSLLYNRCEENIGRQVRGRTFSRVVATRMTAGVLKLMHSRVYSSKQTKVGGKNLTSKLDIKFGPIAKKRLKLLIVSDLASVKETGMCLRQYLTA